MVSKEEIIEKYMKKLELETEKNPILKNRIYSREYLEFKKQYLPKTHSWYEKLCKKVEKANIAPDKKTREKLEKDITLAHLDVTSEGVYSAAVIYPLIIVFIFYIISSLIFMNFVSFIIPFLIIYAVLVNVMLKIPSHFANSLRLKASNQMVQCIFYIVSYMRHTSNLELAIEFASDRIEPPLALDLKKVLWDVESGKYESIKESLDEYLETWRETNIEFVESFHLIEGSLYEPTEDRRINMLEKALRVILEETYEKMLHYAHSLKGPINMLYMLGIILPILSLVILPLVGSMMTNESLTPGRLSFSIFLLYNIILPLIVYTQGKEILSKRPTGYGDTDISESNPELNKLKYINILGFKINPLYLSIFIIIIGLIIGFLPVFIQLFVTPQNIDAIHNSLDFSLMPNSDFRILGYKLSGSKDNPIIIGPYGILSTILSIIMILLLGLGIGFYYNFKYKKLYNIRENAKKLEDEFSSALFQLGNRLGDGIPAELAFEKAAKTVERTVAGDFFTAVALNIRRLGMNVKDAIFDIKRGALSFFPSPLIESAMRVLIESIKKGPLIASQALINISEYIREIHRVNERLRDLLADIISDMKQQISILAPAIAGIVVGITAMIMTILSELSRLFKGFSGGGFNDAIGAGGVDPGTLQLITTLFGDGVPTYYFQIIVGLYIVEITIILTMILNGIENGSDSLYEKYLLGKNLLTSTMLYFIISLATTIIFSFVAASIIPKAI